MYVNNINHNNSSLFGAHVVIPACVVIAVLGYITTLVMGILGLTNVVSMSIETSMSLLSITIVPLLTAMIKCCCNCK